MRSTSSYRNARPHCWYGTPRLEELGELIQEQSAVIIIQILSRVAHNPSSVHLWYCAKRQNHTRVGRTL